MSAPASRLTGRDVLRLGTAGPRARPVRAGLAALGIAIGIAAMIAVLGVSASSRARLEAQLDALGTNLLTAAPGQTAFGEDAVLPPEAVGRIGRIDGVLAVSSIGLIDGAGVYRSHLSDERGTGGLGVYAAHPDLLDVTAATVRAGAWLNGATGRFPAVVLGDTAARRLGVATPGTQVWLGGRYFTVTGILAPAPLAPELDTAALVGQEAAAGLLGYDGSPTTVYERSADEDVAAVRELLARAADPEAPDNVEVSRPSDALAARDAADQAFTGLLLGVGSVALLVGGIGVANTMVVSVLERRREIGLRRALGATRGHIRVQFLAEALVLSAAGGAAGVLLGVGVTGVLAALNGWPLAVPPEALAGGLAATVLIGGVAGLYPAVRAARTPPTSALDSG
ncbi:ABC transporter permease [Allonocardiopsis opalescens]|uniref:Putative ABC transport system permease protein n=1 Tax=Allonocardiopsis opalescens TaxID=1144618 RepID=A0A2T0Q255_9ACTN|nr:ABC transporter permease [Allonocardiopsis opalescens]PRX97790.1 putative ABC transport system permease protein [Allonocardiopsis opalescens]